MTDPSADASDSPEQDALLRALAEVLAPIAELAVGRGLPIAAAQELLKRAFVQAALAARGEAGGERAVSRISTATGIHRREVTRLLQSSPAQARPARSLAAEVFAHWTTARDYRDARGQPLALARQGPAPSFESLAKSVTRDVHPRSLLDELLRLGLATHDAAADRVALRQEAFVPHGDVARMLGFFGDNVADHARAAAANVLSDGRRHFEQAVFADELSAQSIAQVQQAISAQWKVLAQALVPLLEKMIEDDREQGRVSDQRLRIGLYSYNEPVHREPAAQAPSAGRPRRAKPPARKRHE